jgi:hypothetical protein
MPYSKINKLIRLTPLLYVTPLPFLHHIPLFTSASGGESKDIHIREDIDDFTFTTTWPLQSFSNLPTISRTRLVQANTRKREGLALFRFRLTAKNLYRQFVN